VKKAVDVFIQLREHLEEKKGTARKLPSTSELIDWAKALHRNTRTAAGDQALPEERYRKLAKDGKVLDHFEDMDPGEKLMVDQVNNLLDGRLPFLNVLLKNWNDYEEYLEEFEEDDNGQATGDGESGGSDSS